MDIYKTKYEKYKNKYLSLKSDLNSAKEKRNIIKKIFQHQTGGAAQILYDNLTCPITYGIMIDPVIASDGRTYERSAITQILNTTNKSPITREELTPTLLSNRPMKDIIDSLITNQLLNDETIQEYNKAIAPQPAAQQVANLIRTNDDIKIAVRLWISSRASAEAMYGHIQDWDTSAVTNMSSLFQDKVYFNEDLSRWNVSRVTKMNQMFLNASSFNSELSQWDVSRVTDMEKMFEGAESFTSDLSGWVVDNVNNMSDMFNRATSFTSDLSRWNMSNVTGMSDMFFGASSFNSDLSGWKIHRRTNTYRMFWFTPAMLVKPDWYNLK